MERKDQIETMPSIEPGDQAETMPHIGTSDFVGTGTPANENKESDEQKDS